MISVVEGLTNTELITEHQDKNVSTVGELDISQKSVNREPGE